MKALKKVQVLKQSYVLKTRFRREKALKALKKVQVLKQSYVLTVKICAAERVTQSVLRPVRI